MEGEMLKILIADDEPGIRRVLGSIVAKTMNGTGVGIELANDGLDAISIILEHERRLLLVISDLVMPNKTGNDVARAAFPYEIPVILVTGTVDLVHADVATRVNAILEKPFDARQIKEAIRKALPSHGF